MKRIVLIILDGLADRPCKELNGKTPLEVANTPNLDWFASRSCCGLLWPIKGIAPESGAAQFVLLGYPLRFYPGRGIIEALGAGLKIKKNCVYFRVNFARIKRNKILNVREKIPSAKVIKKINSIDPDMKLIPTVGYRGVLEVKNISTNVSSTHPGYVRYKNFSRAITREWIKRKCRGDKKSCNKLNSYIASVEKILKNRTLLLRGASNKLPVLKKMSDWSFIGDMPVELGLAKLAGMKILKRKNEILQILKEKGNVYVQIKGPDVFGHAGDVKGKIKAIEKIDKMLGKLKKIKNAVLCITADHATPCSLKRHSSDPVPYLIFGKEKKDEVKKFCERACRKGLMLEGYQLMEQLKKARGK